MLRKRTRSIECMKIEKVVGKGTFGTVYKAIDKTSNDNNNEVALKQIKMEKDVGFPVTAIREIKFLNLLKSHNNIINLREIVTFDGDETNEPSLKDKKFDIGDIFMVLDFVHYDLSGLLKSPTFMITENHIRSYLYQLLNGIKYLHDHHILHRDIKTANLLITKNNVLKIADFGLTRTLPDSIGINISNDHHTVSTNKNTNTNTGRLSPLVVTLWYRSPDVIVGNKNYNKDIDIWSAGCIFGEMKTRIAIFRGETEPVQLDLIFKLTGYPQGKTLQYYEDIEKFKNFKCDLTYTNQFENIFLIDNKSNNMLSDSNNNTKTSRNMKVFDQEGLDLLQKLLEINPTMRITAEDALKHTYLKDNIDPSSLPMITIAPVTDWMDQERMKAKHELDKKAYLERQVIIQQQQQHQYSNNTNNVSTMITSNMNRSNINPIGVVPKNFLHMQQQNNSNVVGKYKIVKATKSNVSTDK